MAEKGRERMSPLDADVPFLSFLVIKETQADGNDDPETVSTAVPVSQNKVLMD